MGVLEATFTATGQSSAVGVQGLANVLIKGATATVQIEKSVDGGTTWDVLSRDSAGTDASYSTSGGDVAFNGTINEPEFGILYRFSCTSYTPASGTVTCRIGSRS